MLYFSCKLIGIFKQNQLKVNQFDSSLMWIAVAQISFCLEANHLSVLKEGLDLCVLSLPPPLYIHIWINVFANVLGKMPDLQRQRTGIAIFAVKLKFIQCRMTGCLYKCSSTSKQSERKYLRSLHQQINLAIKGLENNLWALRGKWTRNWCVQRVCCYWVKKNNNSTQYWWNPLLEGSY